MTQRVERNDAAIGSQIAGIDLIQRGIQLDMVTNPDAPNFGGWRGPNEITSHMAMNNHRPLDMSMAYNIEDGKQNGE